MPAPRRSLRSRGPLRGRPLAAAVVLVLATALAGLAGCGGEDPPTGAGTSGGRKITVAGDSISVGLGSRLRTLAPDGTTVKVIGEVGTGLARPDRYDWPARMQVLARRFPPSVLVFSVGSNDAQDLTDASGATVVTRSDPDWEAEYTRRLEAVFDAFEDTGTTVVWVGHVRTAEERVGDTNRLVHRLAAAAAADRDWVQVADLGELLGTGDEEATDCLRPDGLHLTTACLDRADRALLPRLEG